MDIVVIGLGSMGKRRIRLIREIFEDSVRICGVDGREDRRKEASQLFDIDSFESIEEADLSIKKKADEIITDKCAFVCTSPLSHAAIIKECLARGFNVFTELNLVKDCYTDNQELAKEKGKTLFLSSTFLYRAETNLIQEEIQKADKWNYVYHIGQYLPDWHPWESFKDFFIGDKRTNGCREIMAIELPWLTKTFGDVVSFKALSDRQTKLPIDYNDNYMLELVHKNGNKGVLVVDVVSPVAVRRFEGYTENRYLQWNGTPESLYKYNAENGQLEQISFTEDVDRKEGYRAFITENAYKEEIKTFFEVVAGTAVAKYGFEDDFKVLDLIDEIEGSLK